MIGLIEEANILDNDVAEIFSTIEGYSVLLLVSAVVIRSSVKLTAEALFDTQPSVK
jgi:hypothetical protein